MRSHRARGHTPRGHAGLQILANFSGRHLGGPSIGLHHNSVGINAA